MDAPQQPITLHPPPPAGAADGEVAVEIRAAAKAFGPTKALVQCDLTLMAGEIHALVGENGSGKSTLIKLLSGVFQPDAGSISWHGEDITLHRPAEAHELGIATVFQEVLIADEASVRDNIFAGTDGLLRRAQWRAAEEEAARRTLDELGLGAVKLDSPALGLSLGQKQLVAVARAVVRPCKLLILDEPTSSLDVDDRERLFAFVRRIATDERAAVLFVSHRIDEIQRLADRVTVLRAGNSVATFAGPGTPDRLAQLMSGRRDESYESPTPVVAEEGLPVPERSTRLVAQDVVLAPGRPPFSLTVRDGEILGLAGLEGHGQVLFLEALAGLRKESSGSISVADGSGFSQIRGLTDGFRKGIAYVPRDRKNEGIFAPLSVLDNVSLPSLDAYSRFGVLKRRRLIRDMTGHLETVRLRGGTIATTISKLSGGNQQKVLLARALAVSPKLLLLNDPTRGVDLGVKAEIYRMLEALAAEGMAIVLLSTEVEELCRLCPRVAVFHELSCQTLLEDDIAPKRIVSAMFGEGSG